MATSILRNSTDTYVAEKYPTKNYQSTPQIYLNGSASVDTRYGYMHFVLPFQRGVTIQSAKLRLWNGQVWAGAVNMAVRRTNANKNFAQLNYNNRPGTVGYQSNVSKTGAAANTMWEHDLTTLFQEVSNGAAWYGLQIWIDNTVAGKWIHSTQSGSAQFRPELEITWSDQPQAPSVLSPSGGRAVSTNKPVLSFDFVDYSGDTTLAAAEIQIDPAANGVAPAWTTATANPTGLPVESAMVDLATTTYPGLAEDATTQWRVRVKDGAGLWSAFSEWASFKRDSFGTLVINNPALSPNNFITEPTPPIIWDYTGHTQTAYQVFLRKIDSPTLLWDSGKLTSTAEEVTLPSQAIVDITGTFEVTVRVWDEVDRVAEGSRRAYIELARTFTYQPSATVSPVTNLVVVQDSPWPWVKVSWKRATAPDSFSVLRDNKVVESEILPSEVFVSGTDYTYYDRLIPLRQSCTYQVQAIVNHVASSANPTQAVTSKPNWSFLMRPDRSDAIALLKVGSDRAPMVDPNLTSMQEMFEPIGGTSPVLITQFIRGYQGKVSAVLADDILPGVTAKMMKDRYKKFLEEKGTRLLLYWLDESMYVICYNMTYRPRAISGSRLVYDIEFDFFEVD